MSRIPRLPNGFVRTRRLEKRADRVARRGPDRWIYIGTYSTDAFTTPDSPAWKNSWDNAGSPYGKMRFRFDQAGRVEFDGVPDMSGASSGTVSFTLPDEYVPANDYSFTKDVLDTTLKHARWAVDATTGDVTISLIQAAAAGDLPWIRLEMDTDQTVPTSPAAPAINFITPTNDYPETFEVFEGPPVSVGMLEEGLYHAVVFIQIETVNPTNGYEVAITGFTMMGESEDWHFYMDPRGSEYRYSELTFRNGPDGFAIYAYVRQLPGNAAFTINWPSTFMEIHKLGPVTNPA